MIGIFDSGIGGLSVYLELKKLLPNAGVVYLSDDRNFPYGKKSEVALEKICTGNIQKLQNLDVNIIIIGCNSATVSTIDSLRHKFTLPIIGIEPAVKVAASNHATKIVLLATERTVCDHNGEQYLTEGQVLSKIHCGELIAKIETDLEDISDEYLKELISPLTQDSQDVVLGCTHYHFVKARLEKLFPEVNFYDPADAVAAHAVEVIVQNRVELDENKDVFMTSGPVEPFKLKLKQILGETPSDVRGI